MYVTRPLSLLLRSHELLNMHPQGPNSGFLVLFDEDCETTNCFGCTSTSIRSLPFPQNKNLTIIYSHGEDTDRTPVLFLPCLDQPLSSNRYYVIPRKGKHQGKAVTSSKEEDMGSCCCCTFMNDVKPRPLDLWDSTYQQVEIIQKRRGSFSAVSVASDGNPPAFLRKKYWSLTMSRPSLYQLSEASGLDSSLPARLPSFNFPLSSKASDTVIIGRWYCPFVFVKESGNAKLKDQMKMSTFYEVTLAQRWEKIFEADGDAGNPREEAVVDVVVEREAVFVGGRQAFPAERDQQNEVIWFRSCDVSNGVEGVGVGLSTKVVERMKWEQERGGWIDQSERQVRVERREKFDGTSTRNWTKFGCYVLVETFVLKRVDKSIALEYDFNHSHQIRCKWEF